MMEFPISKSFSEESQPLKKGKRRKKFKKLPSDLMQLLDKEESNSDSDVSIPEPQQKTRKVLTKRMAKRKEKLRNKSVEGLKYLLQWKVDKTKWKFNRKIQAQLIGCCLNRHVMTVDNFPHFLEYASSIKGGSTLWLKKLCEEKIQEYDSKLVELGEEESVPKDLKSAKKRAEKVLGNLNIEDSPEA